MHVFCRENGECRDTLKILRGETRIYLRGRGKLYLFFVSVLCAPMKHIFVAIKKVKVYIYLYILFVKNSQNQLIKHNTFNKPGGIAPANPLITPLKILSRPSNLYHNQTWNFSSNQLLSVKFQIKLGFCFKDGSRMILCKDAGSFLRLNVYMGICYV